MQNEFIDEKKDCLEKKMLYIGNLKSSFQYNLYKGFIKSGFKVKYIPYLNSNSFFKKIQQLMKLVLYISSCDLIFVEFLNGPAWLVSKINKIFKKPVFVRCHRAELFEYFEKYSDKVIYAARNVTLIICVSNKIKERLLQIEPKVIDKTVVVHNGVDIKKFIPAKKKKTGRFVIGSLGFLTQRKGFLELIDVFWELVKEGLNIYLSIAGTGQLYNKLKKRAEELGIIDRVSFEGFIEQDKIVDWYNSLDLFVLNSRSEGHPIVMLEAMSCGLPVIATDVGGVRETLDEKWIYQFGDKETLKELIRSLYSATPEYRTQIGMKNREIIEKYFSLDNQIKNITKAICMSLSKE